MPVATTQLVMKLLILVVHSGAPELIRVILESDWAVVADHRVPFGDNAGVLDTLVMGGGAVVVSMVNAETPPAVFPQGAVPFGVVGFFVAAFKAVGEGGALTLVSLFFWDSTCFEAVFSFDVTPLVFGWPLSGENTR